MTIDQVKAEVKLIKALVDDGDFESAHGHEDDLLAEVLATIAEDNITKQEMIELAKAALKAVRIPFHRHCA